MDQDNSTRDLVEKIRQADYQQLMELVTKLEAQYQHAKLLMELAKSKQDGSRDYFEYLVEHINKKYPAEVE